MKLIFDWSTKKDYLSAVILKSQRRLEPHWCKSDSSCLLALCFSTQWVGRLKTEEKFLSPVPIGFVMIKWTRPSDCHHFFVFTFLALIVNYFSRCARGRDYFCRQYTHLHMYNFLASIVYKTDKYQVIIVGFCIPSVDRQLPFAMCTWASCWDKK